MRKTHLKDKGHVESLGPLLFPRTCLKDKDMLKAYNLCDSQELYSQRASNTFNQVTEAKRFEGVFLCRKVC